MNILKKTLKRILLGLLAVVTIFVLFILSVTQLDDRFSAAMRISTQKIVNSNIYIISNNTANNSLTVVDKYVLHSCVLIGVSISYLPYPEASKLLLHYIYGNGKELELSSSYFKNSKYLKEIIKKHGNGKHGPLTLKQKDDWRLSLALNPYYLEITDKKIRIYHPKIEFAHSSNNSFFTIVPMGKLKLKVYDNIISALRPKPFYVYAEWSNYTK